MLEHIALILKKPNPFISELKDFKYVFRTHLQIKAAFEEC